MEQNREVNNVPVVAVVGQTASGKSALALQLAQQFGGEIIAADAMTVYRSFDVGTAKPTRQEQHLVPHHMVDIVDASDTFTAADFKQLAEKAIKDISGRGKLSILVGGSGLYIDSILFDYDFRARPDSKLRETLNEQSLESLQKLIESKRLSTEGIDMYNKRRLIRLIESAGQQTPRKPLRSNTIVIGIDIAPDQLRLHVRARTEAMFEQGLADEARKLSRLYGWEAAPMRSIGYREWQGYFLKQKTIEQVKNDIIIHTMQLAKKQRTWFKRNEGIHWVNNITEAVEYTTTILNK